MSAKLLPVVFRTAAACLSCVLVGHAASTCEPRAHPQVTDVIVVGAGVVGLSVARELAAKYAITVKVLLSCV